MLNHGTQKQEIILSEDSVVTEIGDSLSNLDNHINKLRQAAEEYRQVKSDVEAITNDLPTDNIF